jgi:hypothetical protein
MQVVCAYTMLKFAERPHTNLSDWETLKACQMRQFFVNEIVTFTDVNPEGKGNACKNVVKVRFFWSVFRLKKR